MSKKDLLSKLNYLIRDTKELYENWKCEFQLILISTSNKACLNGVRTVHASEIKRKESITIHTEISECI